ncbi:MAG: hypothetical protein D6701_07850 [Gemmatimonadetes bacterium]|nr:MAG: hypothetical protein D6701_07850 [Gemmatimonadota bacterium]
MDRLRTLLSLASLTLPLAASLATASPGVLAAQVDPGGHWEGAIGLAGSEIPFTLDVEQAGDDWRAVLRLPGQDGALPLPDFTYDPPRVRFELPTPSGAMQLVGTLQGDSIDGLASLGDLQGTFRLRRGMPSGASRPGAGARTLAPHPPEGAKRVEVGSALVSGQAIEAYSARFTLTRRTADGREAPFGAWTDRVERLESDAGPPLLRREVARYTADGRMDLWRVHLAEAATLGPLRIDQRFGPELRSVVHIDHQGPRVVLTRILSPEAPAVVSDTVYATAPFDLSLYAVLLLGFPREPGFRAAFPVVGPTGELGWEVMTVEDTETLTRPDGTPVETWRVSTAYRPWTVWFEAAPPYIVRIEQRFPDGSTVVSEREGR